MGGSTPTALKKDGNQFVASLEIIRQPTSQPRASGRQFLTSSGTQCSSGKAVVGRIQRIVPTSAGQSRRRQTPVAERSRTLTSTPSPGERDSETSTRAGSSANR